MSDSPHAILLDDDDGDVQIIGELVRREDDGNDANGDADGDALMMDSSESPQPAAAAAAASPSAARAVQSRSGRSVKQPKEIYTVAKEKPTPAKAAKGANSAKRKSQAKAKSKGKTAVVEDEEYHGEGFTVREHGWYPQYEAPMYASPSIKHLDLLYTDVTAENACAQAEIILTRQMMVHLKETTREQLAACLSKDGEKGETDRLVLTMCEQGEIRGCGLFQSDPNDVDSIKVITKRFIKDKECVCIYMGQLMELTEFEKEYPTRHTTGVNLCSYDLPKELLPTDYNGPNLCLETNIYGNEARFIRDARWDDKEISPNVQCRIVWNHQRGLPFVALVAMGDIAENAELFVDWGFEAWSAHARHKLHKRAHTSHRHHMRLKQLQDELAERGVEPWASLPKAELSEDVAFEEWHYEKPKSHKSEAKKRGRPSLQSIAAAAADSDSAAAAPAAAAAASTAAVPAALPFYRARSRRFPSPDRSSKTPTFVLRNTKHVFEACGVKLMDSCDYSALRPEALRAWELAAGTRHAGINDLNPDYQLVLKSGRCPKAAIYEVVSMRHPARFYCPPDYTSYALLAREDIAKGEPIGVYVGSVHEAAMFHSDNADEPTAEAAAASGEPAKRRITAADTQFYAYDMNAGLFADAIKSGKSYRKKTPADAAAAGGASPDAASEEVVSLICESLSVGGNETRFVNDCWTRAGGARASNAEASPMFNPISNFRPVMIIQATKAIKKGEEIITDYGNGFWNKISTALCSEHADYQKKALDQIEQCEAALLTAMRQEAAPHRCEQDDDAPFAQASPAAAAAAASAVGAAASPITIDDDCMLPPPPDKYAALHQLFNPFDVHYTHRPAPVRFDPVRHHDPFVQEMWQRCRAIKEQERIDAVERLAKKVAAAEKTAARLAASVAKKAAKLAAAVALKASCRTQPSRNSARTSFQREVPDATPRVQQEFDERKDGGAPDADEPMDDDAASDEERSDSYAPLAYSSDSDVEVLSAAPAARPTPLPASVHLTAPREALVCTTADCAEPAQYRPLPNDRTLLACRDCHKKRLREEAEQEQVKRKIGRARKQAVVSPGLPDLIPLVPTAVYEGAAAAAAAAATSAPMDVAVTMTLEPRPVDRKEGKEAEERDAKRLKVTHEESKHDQP